MTIKELGIDRLSVEERINLALEIWESLGDDWATTGRRNRRALQLSDEQRAELARRNAELDDNPDMAMSWEQIRARIEGCR